MTSINSAVNNNAYYQLSNPSAGAGSGSVPSLSSSLAQALDPTSSASPDNAYLLDLSPQAQQLVNGTGSASGVTSSGGSGSFVLSAKQQAAISAIIAKYKDAPYTQATFNQIQNDLSAAGLGTSQLSQEDQAHNFNSTQLFIDDLNGNFTAASAITSPDESGKSASYMQQIIGQWQSLSSSYKSASSSGLAAAGGA